MEKSEIRTAIATDLKGMPSRNPDSLIPTLAKLHGLKAEEVSNQVHQMRDIGHIVPVGQSSIRLSDEGEQFYFATKEERITKFLKLNWPHITSHLLAILALIISLWLN
ncbi:MAG TPA: hypothetical protein VJI73_00135 [Candidatus Paceibacterota bacterium]